MSDTKKDKDECSDSSMQENISNEEGELIIANTPNSKSNEASPSAIYVEPSEPVLFQIKDYEQNEEGIPIIPNIERKEIIGEKEILISKKEKYKGVQDEEIEDAEPDPVNYDEQHWKQYDHRNGRRRNSVNSSSNVINCRLRLFQCFSFLSCLLSIVALLTDNLTTITGQHQYGYYNDTIVCGWNEIHMIEYDVTIGITQSVIKYNDDIICNQNNNHHICHNLKINGLIWIILSIVSVVIIFVILLAFCCVFPLKPDSFDSHKTTSGLFIGFYIFVQVIAVIIWVSNDFCYDQDFIQTFYNKHIESITNGSSIDVMIGSMLCGLFCTVLIVCVSYK